MNESLHHRVSALLDLTIPRARTICIAPRPNSPQTTPTIVEYGMLELYAMAYDSVSFHQLPLRDFLGAFSEAIAP